MGELFATLFVLIIYLCITEKWGGMNAYQLQTVYVWGVSRDSLYGSTLAPLAGEKDNPAGQCLEVSPRRPQMFIITAPYQDPRKRRILVRYSRKVCEERLRKMCVNVCISVPGHHQLASVCTACSCGVSI